MTDAPARPPITAGWVAGTLGYIFLAVFATTVLVNAFQSFFWERTFPIVTGGASGVVGALIAGRRWRQLTRASQPEETP